jgi:RNA-directed DNA polymerase
VLQALAQILTPLWEPAFSPCSFAYRPGRSAHDAILLAQQQLQSGNPWVVDLDIEKFFDSVDHLRLMLRLRQRIDDVNVLDLIADFLRAGRRHEDGTLEPTRIGIAQGSPLSPLLANIVLDELDQEYTRLGWPFVRYADDCILLAGSEAEARARLDFTAGFLDDRLKLNLHPHKTRVVPPEDTAFLGFTYRISRYGQVRRRVTRHALDHFKQRVTTLARPGPSRRFKEIVTRVATFVRGWSGYFDITEDDTLAAARAFARQQLRVCAWELWRTPQERTRQLARRGVPPDRAEAAAYALLLPDQLPNLPVLAQAFPNQWFNPYGLGDKPPRPARSKSAIRHPQPEIGNLLAYLAGPEFHAHLQSIAAALDDPDQAEAGRSALAAIRATLARLLGAAHFPAPGASPQIVSRKS